MSTRAPRAADPNFLSHPWLPILALVGFTLLVLLHYGPTEMPYRGDRAYFAYLAQCIYARAQTENPVDVRLMSANPHGDDVFYQAWDMAGDVLDRGVNRWTEEADHLLFLVEGHPWYEESAGDMAGYHGLHRFDSQVARARAATASEPAAGPAMGPHRRPAMGR